MYITYKQTGIEICLKDFFKGVFTKKSFKNIGPGRTEYYLPCPFHFPHCLSLLSKPEVFYFFKDRFTIPLTR